MADINKILSEVEITSYILDPDATSLTDVAWVDFRDIRDMAIQFLRTVGTSTIVFNIIANTASDGTGDEAIIKVITPAAAPDLAGDRVNGSVTAEEVAQKSSETGFNLRYVSANISFETGTDEATVIYVSKSNRFKFDGLTSDSVAT